MARSKNFNFQTFQYTKHFLQKADERSINLNDVEFVIEFGEMIAEYADDKPYKSYLYFTKVNGKPLHVCFAPTSKTECVIITAYEPSLLIFENDFKTRRKK